MNMTAPKGPPMTTALKLWLGIIAVFMVISAGIMVSGVVLWRQEVDARVAGQCKIIRQVKNAALSLAKPTPETGVTDPFTLARIRISNAAKADARHQLSKALACAR